MARCWEIRDCDEGMQATCPHTTVFMDRCPQKCAFAVCMRETRAFTSDPALVFGAEVDRAVVIKEECMYCEHFLTRGPSLHR